MLHDAVPDLLQVAGQFVSLEVKPFRCYSKSVPVHGLDVVPLRILSPNPSFFTPPIEIAAN